MSKEAYGTLRNDDPNHPPPVQADGSRDWWMVPPIAQIAAGTGGDLYALDVHGKLWRGYPGGKSRWEPVFMVRIDSPMACGPTPPKVTP